MTILVKIKCTVGQLVTYVLKQAFFIYFKIVKSLIHGLIVECTYSKLEETLNNEYVATPDLSETENMSLTGSFKSF